MNIIISPAKKMNVNNDDLVNEYKPVFMDKTNILYDKLKSLSYDELKKLLMVEDVKSYNRFPDFRRFVLEKAQLEINELTDIDISFEPIKTGRKVTSIKFTIEEKFKSSRK